MTNIYYCIDKVNKTAISAGELPETWGNVTGLSGVTDEAASDLTWAGYPDFGFVTQEKALSLGVKKKNLDEVLALGTIFETIKVKDARDVLLAASDGIVTKSLELNIPVPVEWSTYRQALRDISTLPGFPWDFEWPTKPITS